MGKKYIALGLQISNGEVSSLGMRVVKDTLVLQYGGEGRWTRAPGV